MYAYCQPPVERHTQGLIQHKAGWRVNTNNIRNMNTNTLCVEHLKYEYTQFLLFIFTNIIRSSTPPLATITALQKAAKELPKYVPRARTYDLLIFCLPLCQI